jgi:DNA-binding NtrC family response regulator
MFKTPSRILLVDDEKDFVEMLTLRLQETGEEVLQAYSGLESLEKLKETEIDVVILDVKMPGMDGIETLQEIKKNYPLVEVIMLTGHATIDAAVQGMKLGAYDFLNKPANFEDLTTKLKKARERKHDQMERIRKAEAASLLRRSNI